MMDRLKIDCEISSIATEIQLDKESLPDEAGPTFMLSINGCFSGYITKQKSGTYKALGELNLTENELILIGKQINKLTEGAK